MPSAARAQDAFSKRRENFLVAGSKAFLLPIVWLMNSEIDNLCHREGGIELESLYHVAVGQRSSFNGFLPLAACPLKAIFFCIYPLPFCLFCVSGYIFWHQIYGKCHFVCVYITMYDHISTKMVIQTRPITVRQSAE